MTSGPEARTAPAGAERWYYAPRNRDIPAPSNREILAAKAGAGGDGVSAYNGVGLPPAAQSPVAQGGLFMYEKGILFLPFAPAEAQSWLDSMRPALDFAIGGVANIFLPLGNIFAEAARDAAVTEALFGKQEQEKAERALQARWEHPGVFVLPIVDIVEAACCDVRGRGLFAKRTGYLAVTTRDAGGLGASHTFGFASPSDPLPAALFTSRMGLEIKFYTARAARKLTGYDSRARDALATLGLEVTAPEVNEASIIEAIKEAHDAGRAGQLADVTFGQLRDTLTEIGNTAWNETKQRLGERMPQEMSRLMVADLEPMLPYYRRVPAMAHQIEVMERVAAGETNRDWTPAWRPDAYHFNFSPDEYPQEPSRKKNPSQG